MATDKWVIRAVVIGLILITLTALCGGIVLSYQGKGVGDFIVSALAGGLGAMSALLAKTGYDHLVNVEQAEQVGPQQPGPQPPGPPLGFEG